MDLCLPEKRDAEIDCIAVNMDGVHINDIEGPLDPLAVLSFV